MINLSDMLDAIPGLDVNDATSAMRAIMRRVGRKAVNSAVKDEFPPKARAARSDWYGVNRVFNGVAEPVSITDNLTGALIDVPTRQDASNTAAAGVVGQAAGVRLQTVHTVVNPDTLSENTILIHEFVSDGPDVGYRFLPGRGVETISRTRLALTRGGVCAEYVPVVRVNTTV